MFEAIAQGKLKAPPFLPSPIFSAAPSSAPPQKQIASNHMTKLQITTALGAALFVVSCEPLPVQPPEQDPPPRDTYDQDNDDRSNSADSRDDARRRPWLRGSGFPVESEGFQPEPQYQPNRDPHLVAKRTDNPDRVISPYLPYNVIDVEGFRSGQLARDPSNGKIFRIP